MPKCPAKTLAPETKSLIGGKLVAGEGDPQPVLNPRTGETIVKIPEATPKQVDLAVHAAEKAFPTIDLTPLAALTNLQSLYLTNTAVTDLTPLPLS